MPREILRARWLLICQLTLGQRMECMLAQRRINVICPTCHTLAQRCANMLALQWPNEQTCWPYNSPTSKLTPNGVVNQNTPLAQRYHAIWVVLHVDTFFNVLAGRVRYVLFLKGNVCYCNVHILSAHIYTCH